MLFGFCLLILCGLFWPCPISNADKISSESAELSSQRNSREKLSVFDPGGDPKSMIPDPPPGFVASAFFSCSRNTQTYPARAGYTYFVEVCGAQGSNKFNSSIISARGGCIYAQFRYPVTETWYIQVGCQSVPVNPALPKGRTVGYNGGFDGGGGGSDIRTDMTGGLYGATSLFSRFIVGGGAGGGGDLCQIGGYGGGLVAGNGFCDIYFCPCSLTQRSGLGGAQEAPPVSGNGGPWFPWQGNSGSPGQGGEGNCTMYSGAGGGGGYYGGGGSACHLAGGGGSSYYRSDRKEVIADLQGVQDGDGVIRIYFFAPPSSLPTTKPSMQPSLQPSVSPTRQPTSRPSKQPTLVPTGSPSMQPSSHPSMQPTMQPSPIPTMQPSPVPSMQPSGQPTSHPSRQPSNDPSMQPSAQPTRQPSRRPSRQPSSQPTAYPTLQPSMQPSFQPTCRPSGQPSSIPTMQPSGQPSSEPSMQPSSNPSRAPSSLPSGQPSFNPSYEITDSQLYMNLHNKECRDLRLSNIYFAMLFFPYAFFCIVACLFFAYLKLHSRIRAKDNRDGDKYIANPLPHEAVNMAISSILTTDNGVFQRPYFSLGNILTEMMKSHSFFFMFHSIWELRYVLHRSSKASLKRAGSDLSVVSLTYRLSINMLKLTSKIAATCLLVVVFYSVQFPRLLDTNTCSRHDNAKVKCLNEVTDFVQFSHMCRFKNVQLCAVAEPELNPYVVLILALISAACCCPVGLLIDEVTDRYILRLRDTAGTNNRYDLMHSERVDDLWKTGRHLFTPDERAYDLLGVSEEATKSSENGIRSGNPFLSVVKAPEYLRSPRGTSTAIDMRTEDAAKVDDINEYLDNVRSSLPDNQVHALNRQWHGPPSYWGKADENEYVERLISNADKHAKKILLPQDNSRASCFVALGLIELHQLSLDVLGRNTVESRMLERKHQSEFSLLYSHKSRWATVQHFLALMFLLLLNAISWRATLALVDVASVECFWRIGCFIVCVLHVFLEIFIYEPYSAYIVKFRLPVQITSMVLGRMTEIMRDVIIEWMTTPPVPSLTLSISKDWIPDYSPVQSTYPSITLSHMYDDAEEPYSSIAQFYKSRWFVSPAFNKYRLHKIHMTLLGEGEVPVTKSNWFVETFSPVFLYHWFMSQSHNFQRRVIQFFHTGFAATVGYAVYQVSGGNDTMAFVAAVYGLMVPYFYVLVACIAKLCFDQKVDPRAAEREKRRRDRLMLRLVSQISSLIDDVVDGIDYRERRKIVRVGERKIMETFNQLLVKSVRALIFKTQLRIPVDVEAVFVTSEDMFRERFKKEKAKLNKVFMMNLLKKRVAYVSESEEESVAPDRPDEIEFSDEEPIKLNKFRIAAYAIIFCRLKRKPVEEEVLEPPKPVAVSSSSSEEELTWLNKLGLGMLGGPKPVRDGISNFALEEDEKKIRNAPKGPKGISKFRQVGRGVLASTAMGNELQKKKEVAEREKRNIRASRDIRGRRIGVGVLPAAKAKEIQGNLAGLTAAMPRLNSSQDVATDSDEEEAAAMTAVAKSLSGGVGVGGSVSAAQDSDSDDSLPLTRRTVKRVPKNFSEGSLKAPSFSNIGGRGLGESSANMAEEGTKRQRSKAGRSPRRMIADSDDDVSDVSN